MPVQLYVLAPDTVSVIGVLLQMVRVLALKVGEPTILKVGEGITETISESMPRQVPEESLAFTMYLVVTLGVITFIGLFKLEP